MSHEASKTTPDDDPSGGYDPHLDEPEWREIVGRGPFSPHYHAASELIGRRWTGAIIRALFHGSVSFVEIGRAIPGVSDRLLTERLKELEAHGVVERRPLKPGGVRQGYYLTEKGLGLRRIVIEIAKWAELWAKAEANGAEPPDAS